jgi:hypothetical protein
MRHVLLAAWLAASPCAHEVELAELGLKLALPAMSELSEDLAPDGDERARRHGLWRGLFGASRLRIELTTLGGGRFSEPDGVAALLEEVLVDEDAGQTPARELLPGSYGWAEFAVLLDAPLHEAGAAVGRQWLLCGLLADDGGAGYVIRVECRPAPDEAGAAALRDFLVKGVRYGGAVRDADWTLDEVRTRWLADAPADTHDEFLKDIGRSGTVKKAVIRTEHYLIMTNSSSGKLFAEKMEENYDEITRTFPSAEVAGRRLMPVFLFRTPQQYYDYYVKIAGITQEGARASKGHAWRDYYATWYEAPGDPVHIHECTHQFFGNRLYLSGGGSWFQEGVAEYVESTPNDRNEVARAVKKNEHTPLREFVQLASLLYSSEDDVRGGSKAADHYKQAALLIEFLRESEFGKEGFAQFLAQMGRTRRGDAERIEAVFREVYGEGFAGVDAKFVEYCKKR